MRVVERRIAARFRGEQGRELGVQHEGGAIATLERFPQLEEAPALVAGRRMLDRPDDREDPFMGGAERVAERGEVWHPLPLVDLERPKGFVQRQEDLERQRLAHGTRVLPRLPDREENRIGIRLVGEEGLEVRNREGGERGDFARQLRRGKDGEHVFPGCLREVLRESLRLGRKVLRDQEQPRDVFGALEIPPHPVERVRDAGKHQPPFEASTQVSLLPPPCEELTTYDPGRNATRVRPPGRTRTDSP